MTSVLLSIRPEFASAIWAGKKRVEFRKHLFRRTVDKVFIYETRSRRGIVGMFVVGVVIRLPPAKAWKRYRRVAGITRAAFFKYFAGSSAATCIEIRKVLKARAPVDPRSVTRGFAAPQSFVYLHASTSRRIERALKR